MIPDRYIQNLSVYSEDEFLIVRSKHITVIGAGGLGGHIIDQLARLGIGRLRIIDNDRFDTTNLNRQLYCDTETVGMEKAATAAGRAKAVNPDVEVEAVTRRFESSNSEALFEGSDLVMDASDNLETKLLIQDCCRKLGIPFVHGAVGGWMVQVSLVLPGQDTLNEIYDRNEPEAYTRVPVPPFAPALAASLQVAEALKYLLGHHNPKKRTLLYMDILTGQMMNIDMGQPE